MFMSGSVTGEYRSGGLGAATIPGLALVAHRNPDVIATEIPGAERRLYLATYDEPPDPPPIVVLRAALTALR